MAQSFNREKCGGIAFALIGPRDLGFIGGAVRGSKFLEACAVNKLGRPGPITFIELSYP